MQTPVRSLQPGRDRGHGQAPRVTQKRKTAPQGRVPLQQQAKKSRTVALPMTSRFVPLQNAMRATPGRAADPMQLAYGHPTPAHENPVFNAMGTTTPGPPPMGTTQAHTASQNCKSFRY